MLSITPGLFSFARRFLRPQRFLRAGDQLLLISRGEFRGGVQGYVEPGGHVAAVDLNRHITGMPLRVVPLAEIQMPAPLVDVPCDEPGDGRDVGIPSPNRLIAVAVVTGIDE